jgi:multiple sugar transport system permease protein
MTTQQDGGERASLEIGAQWRKKYVQSLSGASPRLFVGRRGRMRREAITAYLFLLPALAIIFVFGLWPVAHALYVSLHKWNIKPRGLQCLPYWLASLNIGSADPSEGTDCLGSQNYVSLLGLQNVSAVGLLVASLASAVIAFAVLRRAGRSSSSNLAYRLAGVIVAAGAIVFLVLALPGLLESGEWTYLVTIGLLVASWLLWRGVDRTDSTLRLILRLAGVSTLLAAGAFFFFVDFQRMWELGNQDLFKSLIYTVFYSAGTVPVQLGVSLALAYVLFQGVKGQGLFRLLYFLPYIAPSVATAVVFKRIFSLRDTGLMNIFIAKLGMEPLKWLHEARPVNIVLVDVINQLFGTSLSWPNIPEPLGVVLAGPSLALVSIIIYSWWVFVGYDTVIYLAGLGSIPGELYEAAQIDGAGRWSLFRRITIPLLSPTTFFLTVIATIGTFKAFNHIWIMQEQAARDTVDTASVLIFRTFRQDGQFGEAAAMAFILFGIILILSQIQNRVGERMVFYG